MGKRGPKPTPTQILKVRGSWRAQTRPDEPQAVPGRPDCPDWLTGEAAEEWTRQADLLEREGRLVLIDRGALALYCAAWGEFVEAYKYVEENGALIVTDKGSTIAHPMVNVRNKSREAAVRIGSLFGFSPSSRTSIKAPEKPKDSGKSRFFKSG